MGEADGGDAAQKRVRALQKKLRQIQQLKDKRDKEGESPNQEGRCIVCRVLLPWMQVLSNYDKL